MKYVIQDDFDVSAQRYWDVFFSEAYNRALWPALDIEWELLALERIGEGEDLVIVREQRLTPRRDVPKIVQKLVKGAIRYTEKNRYVARESRMETRTIPSFGADKIENHGVYRVESLGPNKCRRIWEGVTECRIALVGGKIEEFLIDEVKESYRRATEFTRKWHAEHPEGT